MERVLSDEEKFRKAEEIYNRRKNINVTVPSSAVNRGSSNKKDYKRIRKMLFQIGISLCIYLSIYFVQYSDNYFSKNVVNKVNEILTYNIDLNKIFTDFSNYIKNNDFFKSFILVNDNNNNEVNEMNFNTINQIQESNNVLLNNTIDENTVNVNNIIESPEIENDTSNIVTNQTAKIENNVDENINNAITNIDKKENLGTGGAENVNVDSDEEQMRADAEVIKSNYEITLPLRGTITSRYGKRDIKPTFHTGIDVARNTGSEIISAINGKVIVAEEHPSYGKMLKIENKDLITVYAHCDELLVNVGDNITMMQKIATVGSTGNSTGPHLHFEIIYCNRFVNPEYVIEFKE